MEGHIGKAVTQYNKISKMNQSHNQPVARPHRVPATNQASTSNPYVIPKGDKCYHYDRLVVILINGGEIIQ